jgi:hypothetical protein
MDMDPVVVPPSEYTPVEGEQSVGWLPLTEGAETILAAGMVATVNEDGTLQQGVVGDAEEPTAEAMFYSDMTVADLKAELDNREIVYDSNALKADLITRLEEDDATS